MHHCLLQSLIIKIDGHLESLEGDYLRPRKLYYLEAQTANRWTSWISNIIMTLSDTWPKKKDVAGTTIRYYTHYPDMKTFLQWWPRSLKELEADHHFGDGGSTYFNLWWQHLPRLISKVHVFKEGIVFV